MTLRRQENARLSYRKPIFSSKCVVTLHLGVRKMVNVGRIPMVDYARLQQVQQEFPQFVVRVGDRNYWQFRDLFYWDNESLDGRAVHALLVTRQQRQDQRISRAQQMVDMGAEPRQTIRGAVADDVKQYVWQRDSGRCRACGATSELQYDHVIPVAMGGASSVENLQILCGPCNRRKGAAITLS